MRGVGSTATAMLGSWQLLFVSGLQGSEAGPVRLLPTHKRSMLLRLFRILALQYSNLVQQFAGIVKKWSLKGNF